jgi:sugar transferase (PEP-CTERM system associated)
VSGVFLSTPSVRTLACVLMDVFVIAATLWIAVAIRFADLVPDYEGALLKGAIFIVAVLVGFYYNDLYSGRAPRGVTVLALKVIQAFVAAGVLLALLYYFVPDLALGRGIAIIHPPIALAAILGWRIIYYWALQQEQFVENVLILGTGSAAVGLARELLGHRSEGFRVVGFLSQDPADVGKSLFNPSVVGTYDDLLGTTARFNVHSVVVALDDQRGVLPLAELLTCKLRGVNVAQSADFFETLTGQLPVRNLRPSSIIFSQGFRKPRFFMTTRRVVEFVLAGVGVVLTSPVLLLAAVAIAIESGFPILFRQERVGQHGRRFTLFKLRTMRQDAERNGAVWAAAGGDPRITRVGNFLRKTRVDEFPQLINVLFGDMSFVGPRPERPMFVEELQAHIPYYGERHSVKPGITGWAQVRNGYTSSIEESEAKLRYDLYYIKNMSFWLDLQILLDTFKVIAFGRGAR